MPNAAYIEQRNLVLPKNSRDKGLAIGCSAIAAALSDSDQNAAELASDGLLESPPAANKNAGAHIYQKRGGCRHREGVLARQSRLRPMKGTELCIG